MNEIVVLLPCSQYITFGRNCDINIDAVFELERPGEAQRFSTYKHLQRQYLYHGSRFSNYVGILNQGILALRSLIFQLTLLMHL